MSDATVSINGGPEIPLDKLRAATNGVDAGHLKAFLERIEHLEEEKTALGDFIKEVYAEAKGSGYDAKIMRKIISLRKMDADKRREEAEILDLYLGALGEQLSLI